MRWLALAALLGANAGCGSCGDDGSAAEASLGLPPVADEASSGVDVPMPGAVYKEAYRRARDQVTVDNADERLDELERTIDQEARELP